MKPMKTKPPKGVLGKPYKMSTSPEKVAKVKKLRNC